MQNSALTQMMATQTNILEEIRDLRRKEDMRNQFATITPGPAGAQSLGPANISTSMPITDMNTGSVPMQEPVSQINMYKPEQHYDALPPATPQQMSLPANPLSYEAVSSIPVVGGVAGVAQHTLTDSFNYDRTRMSKEATAEYFAQRSQGIQMGTVEGAGKVVEGAGMASGFLVGGLVGGMAVGTIAGVGASYVAGSMVGGARDSLNYQDILRRDGYKAFNALESTTEYGGIGMKLDDQQEISSFMRDLSVDKFMDDAEISQILQGSLDNKLLKSVDDVKSFKDKFSNIVDSVKEISLTLNQTIDEAVAFMGEMERRGVTMDKRTNIAATGKVAASFLGTDANEYMQQMMAQTDSIVSGTSMNAGNVMQGIGFNAYLTTAIEDISSSGDGVLKQYIKNRGGAAAVSGEMESSMRSFFESTGQNQLVGMFGAAFTQDEEGNFSLDRNRLDELINSGKSYDELSSLSRQYTSTLSNSDQVKLASSAGQIFNESAQSSDLFGALGYLQEQYQNVNGMDSESALVSMGLTSDFMDARVLDEAITAGTNSETIDQFAALSLKEQWDSARNSRNPSLTDRFKYGLKGTFTNPLGDMGQYISDGVGDITQDIQMLTSGIEESNRVGGDILREMSPENMDELFAGSNSNNQKVQDILNEMNPNRTGNTMIEASDKTSKRDYTYSDFSNLVDDVKKGRLSSAELATLREDLDSGTYNKDTEQQLQYALNLASGEYDGFWNTVTKQAKDNMSASFEWSKNPGTSSGRSEVSSLEEIKKEEERIKENIKKASTELNKLMIGGDNLGVSSDRYAELEENIRSGNLDAVKEMTSNNDVLGIAEKFKNNIDSRDKIESASDWYMEDFRSAQGAIQISSGVYDFIKASGVYSEEEFNSRYNKLLGSDKKDLEKRAKKARNNLGEMSDQEVFDTAKGFMEEGQEVLEKMGSTELQRLAESFAADMPSINIEDLYKEGTSEIDAAKLYKSYADTTRLQQAGGSAAEGAILDSKDVSKTSEEHLEAMETMLATFVSETGKMNQAIEDIRSKNYGKYTGI